MAGRLIEARSFDHVPEAERRGRLRGQLAFWFMINANLLTLYTGAVGPAAGLPLGASLLAILLGTLFGTLFQAFHGAQGPRMGLAQVIQSRAQFGARGVLLPILAAIVVPFGFAVFFLRTAATALASATGGPEVLHRLGLTVLAAALAIFGHRWLMKVQGAASLATVAALVALTVIAAGEVTLPTTGALTWSAFTMQLSASAIYQLAVAPVVSDYTRYLHKGTGGLRISGMVFLGTVTSALWLEALGAFLAAAMPGTDPIAAVQSLALGSSLGPAIMAIAALGCLTSAGVSAYSGSLTLLSGLEAFGPLQPTAGLRSLTLVLCFAPVLWAVLAMPEEMLPSFGTFLGLLGYVLIPWTAVNLVDDYLIRKGAYSISDILDRDGGIYGRWGWRGLVAYGAGLVALVPFIPGISPLSAGLSGLDLCVGLGVSGLSYALLMRHHDAVAERARIRRTPIHTLSS